MPAQGQEASGERVRTALGWVAGAAVLLAGLAHIPPAFAALESFDAPKRVVWLAALALILGAAGAGRRRACDRRLAGLAGALAALAAWMAARTLLRPDPWVELESLTHWLLPVLALLAGLLVGPAPRPLGLALAWSLAVQVLLMAAQHAWYDPLFGATTGSIREASWRMLGTLGYQNQAAAFVALAGLGLAALAARPALAALRLAPALLTAGAAASRGVFLGLAAAAAAAAPGLVRACGPLRSRRAPAVGLGLAVLAVAAGLCLPAMRGRLRLLVTDPSAIASNVGSRIDMARVAWAMWSERPVTGWGAGAFAAQYLDRLGSVLPARITPEVAGRLVFAREAHNDYLQFAAEFGLIGVALAALALALAVRLARRATAARARPWVAALAAFMGMLALVEFPWQTAGAGPLAGLLLGMLLADLDGPAGSGARGFRALWLGAGALACAGLLVEAATLRANLAVMAAVESGPARALAAELRERVPWTHRQRAFLGARLAANGDWADGLAVLEEAVRGFRDTATLNNLGRCYAEAERWSEAAAVYGRWAATGLHREEALWNRIAALARLRRYGEAADDMAAILAYWDPLDIRRWEEPLNQKVVYLLHKAGRSGAAFEHLSRLTWPPGQEQVGARLFCMLARLCLEQGQRDDAGAAVRAALRLDPGSREALELGAQLEPAE